jgi:hypothetical protein
MLLTHSHTTRKKQPELKVQAMPENTAAEAAANTNKE